MGFACSAANWNNWRDRKVISITFFSRASEGRFSIHVVYYLMVSNNIFIKVIATPSALGATRSFMAGGCSGINNI